MSKFPQLVLFGLLVRDCSFVLTFSWVSLDKQVVGSQAFPMCRGMGQAFEHLSTQVPQDEGGMCGG